MGLVKTRNWINQIWKIPLISLVLVLIGIIQNSCKLILVLACLPPLITLTTGIGSLKLFKIASSWGFSKTR